MSEDFNYLPWGTRTPIMAICGDECRLHCPRFWGDKKAACPLLDQTEALMIAKRGDEGTDAGPEVLAD